MFTRKGLAILTFISLAAVRMSWSAPVYDLTVDSTSCYSTGDGKITITITSGTPDFNFSLYYGSNINPDSLIQTIGPISTPNPTVQFLNLEPRKYLVLVTDNSGGGSFDNVTIYHPSQLMPGVISVVQGLTCFNSCDAKLQANPTGGTPPYSYQWTNGDNTRIADSICQGTHYVTITDANGCGPVKPNIFFVRYDYSPFNSYIPADITISSVTHTDACDGMNNGTITVNASGGTSPLNYAISSTSSPDSTIQAGNFFNSVLANTYRVWVVDDNSCTKQYTPDVTVASVPPPTANAGADGETCAGTSYIFGSGDASATNQASVNWTSSGSGTFSNGNTLTPTYNPSAADISSGSVTLTLHAVGNSPCGEATDDMILTITPAPTANAGPDRETCETSDYTFAPGDASATNNTSVYWTSSGTGSFTNGSTLTPIYSPSAADKSAGSVTLTLHATGNGSCAEATDNMILTITNVPTANAGADDETCETSSYTFAPGHASATNNASVYWTTSGTGSFTNGTTLTPTYNPSAADITAGTVTLTLHAVSTGSCAEATNDMILTITPAPTANAGADDETCETSSYTFAPGYASATNNTSVYWTSSGTGSFINGNTLNPTYNPSAADITAGSVTLTLHATGNGSCAEATDDMILTITAAPTANAGADDETCETSSYVFAPGYASATNNASVNWTTSGTGTFTGGNTLTPTYNPSAADITAGSVTLTLHATGNGSCAEVTDDMILTITAAPTANAGADDETCETSSYTFAPGHASATNNASVYWTSSGSGSFTGGNTLTPTYNPSAADITAGSVTLTLHATGNGSCAEATDDMTLTITAAPTANAGADDETCETSSYTFAPGHASATNNASVYWTTSGTGAFTGGNTLTPTYNPSAADITAGSVTLTLHSTGNGSCAEATDDMILTITSSPTANAGADDETCETSSYTFAPGHASATNNASVYWTSSGSGSFTGGNTLTPTYSPSVADIATGTVTLTLHAVSTGSCAEATDNMILTITAAPTANAGADDETCETSSYTFAPGHASATNNASVYWTTSGTGTFTNGNTLTPTYNPSAADISAGSVTLTLHSTGNGSCAEATDDMILTITPAPAANAGADDETCETSSYTFAPGHASATNNASVYWTSSGTGTFTNGNTLTSTYNPSAADITAGSVTLTLHATGNGSCAEATDDMILTITPAPTANAGADDETCETSSYTFAPGHASATNNTSVYWTTSGTGSFTNGTTLTPTYNPSAADISAGSVTLTLHATGNGSCAEATDDMILTITPAPTANAGADDETCETSSYVFAPGHASATNNASVNWTTSGTGTFTGGNTLTPTYNPSAADITAGSVTLTLHATGNGSCAEATDDMTLTITPAPTANAGPDGETCETSSYIFAAGDASATNNASVNWTSSGTGTFTNGNTLTPTYNPSAADITAGSVTLTLHAAGNGSCAEATDDMTLTITAAPTANAGADDETCETSPYTFAPGHASATNNASVYWTSSSGGSFINGNTLTPTYNPTVTDVTNGSVTLTLHATGNGSCAEVTDNMILTVTPLPTANAGPDGETCETSSYTFASGDASATNNASVNWTSSGTGTFTGGNTLTPTYNPSAADITAGSVTLTLHATGNGSCAEATDDMILTITPAPTANAGADDETCETSSYVFAPGHASATNNASVNWTTSGTGSFTNGTTLTPTYNPSAADISAGSVTLTLHATGNGSCAEATDDMILTITPAPTANAGPDGETCETSSYIFAAGDASATNNASVNWTSSGTGTFTNGNTLTPTYNPSAADITAGSVTLTLHATGNGSCAEATDDMILTITPAPTANAGPDGETCETSSYTFAPGDATATNYASVNWTTSGTGLFTNGNTLTPEYVPSAADITAGSVTLTLHATGNGSCPEITDDMILTITKAPTAFAGADATICYGSDYQVTDALVSNNTSINWTTSGDGTFDVNSIINPTYTPGTADLDSGLVTLYISAPGSGSCAAAEDSLKLTIPPQLQASIGTSSPFLVGVNTQINVCLSTNDHQVIQDMGYYLVAPDGVTTLELKKSPMENDPFIACNFGSDVDSICFTTELPITDTLDVCSEPTPLSGTFAATGSWNIFYGMNPAEGGWSIELRDFANNRGGIDGNITSASITFTDTTALGDTVQLRYESGPASIPIIEPVSTDYGSTFYQVPLGLRTKCHSSCDAIALVNVTGGTQPYASYDWSDPGLPKSDSVGLCEGSYTVTVTDAMGCTATADVNVLSPPEIKIVSFFATDSITCPGDSSAMITAKAVGGTGELRYRLFPGGIYSASADSGLFENLPGGNYTLEIRDINGCTIDSTGIFIYEPQPLEIDTIITDSVTCNGGADGSIAVTAKGGKAPYTYWIQPGAEINNDGLFENLPAGKYVIRFTDVHSCDTVASDTIMVNEPTALTIDTVIATDIICSGGTGEINIQISGGTPPYEASIDSGATYFAYTDFTGLSPDTFHIAVRDNHGCEVFYTTPVIFTDKTPITIDSLSVEDVTGCFGNSNGSIYIRAAGGLGPFTYSVDGVNYQTGNLFAGLPAGDYTIYMRDSIGCVSPISRTISQPDELNATIIITAAVGLTKGSITINPFGGTPPYGNYSIDNGTNVQDTNYFGDLDPGDYDVYFEDSMGCVFTKLVTVTENQLSVNIISVQNASCYGIADGEIILLAADGVPPYEYSYNGSAPQAEGIFQFLEAGIYNILVKDANGKTYRDTITITEPDEIVVDSILTRPSCNNVADGSVELQVSGGTSPYTYEWSTLSTSSIIANLYQGNYTVTVTDDNNCGIVKNYKLTALDSAIAYAGPDTTLCYGTDYRLNASGGDLYQWSPDTMLSNAAEPNPVLTADFQNNITYYLIVTKGVCVDYDTVTISVFDTIGMYAGPDQYITQGESVELSAKEGYTSYRWRPSDYLSDPTAQITEATPPGDQLYIAIGTTPFGCLEADTVGVFIRNKIEEIFSGFTPNGDGINDKWIIHYAYQYPDIEVQVFNRWGERIFYSKGYDDNKAWDGTYKGKKLPVGTYYYVIKINDGFSKPLSGTVTIVR